MIQVFCDGLIHILSVTSGDIPDYQAYTSSTNTQAALAAAYAAGNWAEYVEPEPVELPPEPNPSGFRAALARSDSWSAWAATIPSVAYTNLTIAAAQSNWAEAQAIYNAIKASTPPAESSIDAWQTLADDNGIPITF